MEENSGGGSLMRAARPGPSAPGSGRLQPWLRGLIGPPPEVTGPRGRPPRPVWQTARPSRLPAEGVVPFLRWLDLTGPGPAAGTLPDPAELGIQLMLGRCGQVSTVTRDERSRAWGRPPGAPRLPVRGALPHLVHAVHLGGAVPRQELAGFAEAARTSVGRVPFVLWTTLRRETVIGREPLSPGQELLSWARENKILLVPFDEVLDERAEVVLWDQIAGRRPEPDPAGPAAADCLRAEIVTLFGGAAVPAGHRLGDPDALERMFEQVSASVAGFVLDVLDGPAGREPGTGNGTIVAPAGHPALHLWRAAARTRFGPGPASRGASPSTGRLHRQVLRLLAEEPGSQPLAPIALPVEYRPDRVTPAE